MILLSELRVGWMQCLWIKLMTRLLSWEIVTQTLVARLTSRQNFSYCLQCRMPHLYISVMSTVKTNACTHTHVHTHTSWSSLESIQIQRLPYIERRNILHPNIIFINTCFLSPLLFLSGFSYMYWSELLALRTSNF